MSSFCIILIGLSGCIQAPQPTADQIAMQKQVLAAFITKMNNSQVMAPNSVQKEFLTPAKPEFITEEEITKSLSDFKNISCDIEFTKHRDGFDVNGIRYIDPEGVIVSYGYDNLTGDVTYLAKTGHNNFSIKYTRALSGHSAVTLATAKRDRGQWSIITRTGKQLIGDSVTPLSKGLLVSRDTAGFIYEPGKEISSFAAPDGFFVANFQNGDILRTRYVLVEKEPLGEGDNVGGLVDSVKSLGANLGINKKEDYILLNIDRGTKVAINVDTFGKKVSVARNCRKMNALVNECSDINFYDSLFEKTGLPNGSHYFWSISWFKGTSGVILITKENYKVTVKNLDTFSEAVAFKRTLGVNWMSAEQLTSGKIKVNAQLGFSKKTIEDAESLLSQPDA